MTVFFIFLINFYVWVIRPLTLSAAPWRKFHGPVRGAAPTLLNETTNDFWRDNDDKVTASRTSSLSG
jgi:hypothetical protein